MALCWAIWKRKPLSLCTYSRNVKSKRTKRGKKNAKRMGECFIFLQQNSLIFFYVETAETETREQKKDNKMREIRQKKMLKGKTLCVYVSVGGKGTCICMCVRVCVGGLVEKKKMAALTQNQWKQWNNYNRNIQNSKRETQTNVTQQFLWVWQKWIIRMDPGHRRLFF